MEKNNFVDLQNVRTDKQMKKYQDIFNRGIDPFSSKEEIEALGNTIIDETDHFWIIENQWPYDDRHVHLVVISKVFKLFPDDLSDEALLDSFKILKKYRHKYGITGGGIAWRFGDTRLSGASVMRIHFHIIQPKEECQLSFYIGSKKQVQTNLKKTK